MSNLPAKITKTRWGDWLSIILLVIIMQIVGARLVATLWTEDLRIVQAITLLGTILGLALGKSIFKRFWVVFFSLAYGLILIPWQIGLTLDSAIRWRDRLINLWGRLGVVISELFTRKPITDNLLFLLLMSILFWTLTIYAGYSMLREGNPWKVIIPAGITAFVIHSFDPLLVRRSWYLAIYLFFALIFVARMVYLKYTAKWKESHTHTPPDMDFDFSRVTLVMALVLVFFAWNVPVFAESFKPVAEVWQSASKPWLTTKDRLSFMFSSLRASVGLVQNFYGNTLALGLGNPLSDQVVMEVEAPTGLPEGFRFYWKARTYSIYDANYWQSQERNVEKLTPDSSDIHQPGVEARLSVETTFFPHSAISNLFAVPEPLWLNLPAQANMTINSDGTVNFEALMSKDIIRPGEQYTVRSAIDAVTSSVLRNAGTAYPQWVLEEYLQLPSNITPRTRELANTIAARLSNPYDMARAVTDYLRSNIEYNQSIIQPPTDQERIDWFLFDYKQGFCNYYASAEVILLRSLGIPARMAVGFAQGERQVSPAPPEIPVEITQDKLHGEFGDTSIYLVRQKDAHAWPEVYFPGIGWVIFEPTASQPALYRPSGETTTNFNQTQPDQGLEDLENQANQNGIDGRQPEDIGNLSNSGLSANFWTIANIIKLIFLVLAIILLGIVVWQVRRGFKVRPFLERASTVLPERLEKNLRKYGIRPPDFLINLIYYQRLPALSRAYNEINRALVRVGLKPAIQDTPSDRTESLVNAIPTAAEPAGKLLNEYQTSIYSSHQANLEVAQRAGVEIRNLSWLAWLGKILARFQEPKSDQSQPANWKKSSN